MIITLDGKTAEVNSQKVDLIFEKAKLFLTEKLNEYKDKEDMRGFFFMLASFDSIINSCIGRILQLYGADTIIKEWIQCETEAGS